MGAVVCAVVHGAAIDRVVRRVAAPIAALVGLEDRRQVQRVNDVADEERQMSLRQPRAQVRRQKVGLVQIVRSERSHRETMHPGWPLYMTRKQRRNTPSRPES